MRITSPVLLLLISAALAGCQSSPDEPCGLGPAPDAPGFAEHNARRAEENKRNGFERVCKANLERYDVSSDFVPLQRATEKLAFKPVDLAATPLAQYQALGGMMETVSGVPSRLYRGFRTPQGHVLTLFEHDMSADGTLAYRAPADEPERINGMAARLVVLEAGSGEAVSVLSWQEGRRYYELWLDKNAARLQLKPQLIALAAALPKSIPAKTDEPARAPITLGPDGRPNVPPPPLTLPADQP
ncbi:hypothetical protein [Pseudoduganella sp. OTU4001]|uniref:hypothetical protein n=1 Tax=Pseudoduganella sp. OTU4001 TaxID=3043854 RepID=UPI00313A92DD